MRCIWPGCDGVTQTQQSKFNNAYWVWCTTCHTAGRNKPTPEEAEAEWRAVLRVVKGVPVDG